MEYVFKGLAAIEFAILIVAFISGTVLFFVFIVGLLLNRKPFNTVFGFNIFNVFKKNDKNEIEDEEIATFENIIRQIIRFIGKLLMVAVFIAILMLLLSYINTK